MQKLASQRLPEDFDYNEESIKIDAQDCKIAYLGNFQAYTSLKYLNLSQNRLGGLLKNGTFILEGLTNLEGLSLRDNKISSLSENVFSKCLNLSHLDLSQNVLSTSFRCLTVLQKLEILDLKDNLIDNICCFKPLRGKLNKLLYLNLKGNPCENAYESNFEHNLKSQYFPTVELISTKFNKVKIHELTSVLSTKKQNIVNMHEILSQVSHVSHVSHISNSNDMRRSESSSALTPIRSATPNIKRCVTPVHEAPHNSIMEASIRKEESRENSQDILSPQLRDYLKKFQSSDRRSKSSDRRLPSSSRRDSPFRGELSLERKIQYHLKNGTIGKETARLNNINQYMEKEMEKVESSVADLRRQNVELSVVTNGFENLIKQTLQIDDCDELFRSLSSFIQTIDAFDGSKVQQLVARALDPLMKREFYKVDVQVEAMFVLLDKLKKNL